MLRKPILGTLAAIGAMAMLASCSWPEKSNWHLADSGYSINALDSNEFAVEVHVNQLKQLGGEINSAEFRLFVSESLKSHGLCPLGWLPLPCVEDGSCVQHTRRSVTVFGRCTAP
jgi:hypothetical protein